MGQNSQTDAINNLEIDRKQIKELQRRFLELNDKRKALLDQNVSERERNFLELLPFLFHINHPTLPGFVHTDAPCGLADYQADKSTIQLAKKYAKSLDYKPRMPRLIQIYGIYLMGSAGSIAHTGQSDLDVWVCHREGMTDDEYRMLSEKRNRIQAWASEQAIDCSIYLVTENQIEDGSAEQTLQTMKSGLLLDEFYRTQIYLAGKPLMWWIIPPEWDQQYDAYRDRLVKQRFVEAVDWIDFGQVKPIPLEEYISNALWYINKALTSPYKTALKLVLMESYLSQYPEVTPLSLDYKTFVYNLIDNSTVVDAYLLMHRKVEEYLINNDQLDRLEFVRRCLYHKIQGRLTTSPKRMSPTQTIIRQLVGEWGWNHDKQQLFDRRNQWDINQIGNEKRLYIKQLITSFRTIGRIVRDHPDSFSRYKRALLTLSRKISAHLELTHGKIEKVNINFVTQPTDKHLSIVRQTKGKEIELWSFYDRAISQQESGSAEPVYQCNSLMELLVWARTNGLLNEGTSVQYRDSMQQLDYDELEHLIHVLLQENQDFEAIDDTVYEQAPLISDISCFINVAHDKLTTIAKQGVHIITSQVDPFCYGNDCYNLIETIDLHYSNSWGEQFVIHFSGHDSLSEAGMAILELIDRQKLIPDIRYYSFSSMRSENTVSRVRNFYRHLIETYQRPKSNETKYVFRLGQGYRVVKKQTDHYVVHKGDDENQLAELLVNEDGFYQYVEFDSRCFSDPVVRAAIQRSEPETHTMVINLEFNGSVATACYVDPTGGIAYFLLSPEKLPEELYETQRFLQNSLPETKDLTWRFYQLNRDHSLNKMHPEEWDQQPLALTLDLDTSEAPYQLTLHGNEKSLTFAADDPMIPKKLASWLDRVFSLKPEQIWIKELSMTGGNLPASGARLILERDRFYQQLMEQMA